MKHRIEDFFKRNPRVVGGLGSLIILIIYLPAMGTYLMGDDFEWLDTVYPVLKNPLQLFELINHFFRPMVKLSYLFNYAFFGGHPFSYNFLTVLLHLVNVYLLYVLMLKITRRIIPSALISFLFGVSALYSEVTLWSAGRPDSIMMVFALAGLILVYEQTDAGYIQTKDTNPLTSNSNETNQTNQKLLRGFRGRFYRKEPPGRRQYAVLLFFLLAAASKETWIIVPFIAFGMVWMVNQVPFKTAMRITLVFFLLAGIYLFYFIVVPILAGVQAPTSYGHLNFTQIIQKFGLLLYKYPGLEDFYSGKAWEVLLIAALLAVLVYRFFRTQNRLALWGLSWMLIGIFISLPIYYAPSRYNYIPLMGSWIMLVAFAMKEIPPLVERFRLSKKTLVIILVLPILTYFVYQVIMLQWEIADYRQRGEMHKVLVDMFRDVKERVPIDRPLVFIDLGARKAVSELARDIQGYKKLLFVRESAIWQQVYLGPLANFTGHPFTRLLKPVPNNRLADLFKKNFTVLVFTDSGFFIPTAREYEEKLLNYFQKHGQLPYKVQALRFETESGSGG